MQMPNRDLGPLPRKKKTGIYAADLIPGNYIHTRTDAVRGEELFSRPDLERPWRTVSDQENATRITLKEKEIEELTRLCSNLRTELGNAKHDMRFIEYRLNEEIKSTNAAKDQIIQSLRAEIVSLKNECASLKDNMTHQLRLLQSQHNSKMISVEKEASLAMQQATELEKGLRKQLEDVKTASARELQLIETRFTSQINGLNAELQTAKEAGKVAEQHYSEQTLANNASLKSIEMNFNEQIRASEELIEEVRKLHAAELAIERKDKVRSFEELRHCTEELERLKAEREHFIHRVKVWNKYILFELDEYFSKIVATFPELTLEPTQPGITSLSFVHPPPAVLEDPTQKVCVEQIIYRLHQMKLIQDFKALRWSTQIPQNPMPADLLMEEMHVRQDRMKAALKEVSDQVSDNTVRMTNLLGRIFFFSDNLEDSIAHAPRHIKAPLHNVVFACMVIENGSTLWASDSESMKVAVRLYYHTLRLKMVEYGCYECYSDSVTMLLAFDNPISACRCCVEAQYWLVHMPWPTFAGLAHKFYSEEELDLDGSILFKGLRVAMAVHTGECFVEDSAVPALGGGCRVHYYGKALSQLIHITALAQGGQTLVSGAVWSLCSQGQDTLVGSVVAKELGPFQIRSFDRAGAEENESIQLLQLLPTALKGRVFKPTSAMEIPTASPLLGVKSFVLSTEMEDIARRRSATEKSMELVKEEYYSIETDLKELMSHTRAARTHFHLRSPQEMVDELNKLFLIIEKVSIRTEEMNSNISHLMLMQEDLTAQTHGLREYLKEEQSHSKIDRLRIEIDLIKQRAQAMLEEAEKRHQREIKSYTRSLSEKDRAIRKLHKIIEQHPSLSRSH